jgi:hypothetical protein
MSKRNDYSVGSWICSRMCGCWSDSCDVTRHSGREQRPQPCFCSLSVSEILTRRSQSLCGTVGVLVHAAGALASRCPEVVRDVRRRVAGVLWRREDSTPESWRKLRSVDYTAQLTRDYELGTVWSAPAGWLRLFVGRNCGTREVRKDSSRVDGRENHGRSEGHYIFRGEKEHSFVRRFPGFARSSFW